MNIEDTHYIYALVDIEAGNKVFYIGRGRNYAHERKERYYQHLSDARRGDMAPVHVKIREIQDAGRNIRFEIKSDFLTADQAFCEERYQISFYGLDNLCNVQVGGFRGSAGKHYSPRTEEQIQNHIDGSHKNEVWVKDKFSGKISRFVSVNEASRELGISLGVVCRAVNGTQPKRGPGTRFEFSYIPFPVTNDIRVATAKSC